MFNIFSLKFYQSLFDWNWKFMYSFICILIIKNKCLSHICFLSSYLMIKLFSLTLFGMFVNFIKLDALVAINAKYINKLRLSCQLNKRWNSNIIHLAKSSFPKLLNSKFLYRAHSLSKSASFDLLNLVACFFLVLLEIFFRT